ncbi:hypothetical protein HMPREF1868_00834 [Olsenella sp. DNF00959]|nr:hypothetical protein HMPREF1868_00834 [Olsenella sp. DNF00959]
MLVIKCLVLAEVENDEGNTLLSSCVSHVPVDGRVGTCPI